MPYESDPEQYGRENGASEGNANGDNGNGANDGNGHVRPPFVIPRRIADPYRVIVMGSSHVRRLDEYVSTSGRTNCGLNTRLFDVSMYGIGGLRLFAPSPLRRMSHHIRYVNVVTPDLLILVVGSNDVMQHGPEEIAAGLVSMAGYALLAGVRHVAITLLLYRSDHTFNTRAVYTNLAIMRYVRRTANPRIRFWRNRGMAFPRAEFLAQDGVHLNHRGNYRFYRSIRGCILRNNNRL